MIKINGSGNSSMKFTSEMEESNSFTSSISWVQNKQRWFSKNANYKNGYSRKFNERKKIDKQKKILYGFLLVINFFMIGVSMFNRAHLRSSFTMASLVLFAITMSNIAIFQVRKFIL